MTMQFNFISFTVIATSLFAFSVQAHEPIATTSTGKVKGLHVSEPDVMVFKGVPYGQSTAGANRFKAPKPVAKWQGVKDALKFGNVCPQGGDVGRTTKVKGELLPISEDCLVLNIWTPDLEKKARPVMVWFHGRGFYAGAGSERLYDGARLADRGGVVVVTVNHRLNVFGHLYLGKIGGDEFATSGNAGVQDMQLALEWVRDNIAAFGGDGKNITIFGESGGGAKVSTLLGVPSAKGLFQRGIIQSGPRLNGTPLATAIKNTETVMNKLGVKTAAELQAVPMEKLLAAVTTTGRTTPDFGPVTDGKYLPADMFVPAAVPSAHNVPVIIGSNRDEYSLYARELPNFGKRTEAEVREELKSAYGNSVDELLAAYKQSRPNASPWDWMIGIRSSRFHIGTVRLAEAQSKVAPTYVYSFDFEPTATLKAAHGAEIPFVFSNATSDPNARPGAKETEDAMSEAWIAFARTGKPNHPGMPEWPTYNTTTRPMMVFDAKTAVVNDLRSQERKVWEGKTLVR
jgi:para-nitrobenzyl esterase